MDPILAIGYIGGALTVQTRRSIWKPGRMLARRRKGEGYRLLAYKRGPQGWVFRVWGDTWLTRRGLMPRMRYSLSPES